MKVSELFSLQGRIAVVTGGAQNLGRSMAEALAEAGAVVHLTSRDAKNAEKTAAELSEASQARVIGHGVDLTAEDAVADLMKEVSGKEGRIDILVNNAGGRNISGKDSYPFTMRCLELHPLDVWNFTLQAYLTTTFLCCKHVLPVMKHQRSGSIINIGSVSGIAGRDRSIYEGFPEGGANPTDYSAAKAAIVGFTRDLAAQVGEIGIRANVIIPGGFERGHHPEFVARYSSRTMLGRMGRDATDMKGAVVYLASDASAYVTAHSLFVDGGFLHFR